MRKFLFTFLFLFLCSCSWAATGSMTLRGLESKFNVTVPENLSTPTISGNLSTSGTVGVKDESYISASSQNDFYLWVVSDGTLPPGLSLCCSDTFTSEKENNQGKNCFL